MKHPRADLYCRLLTRANGSTGQDLRNTVHDAAVLASEMTDAEFADALGGDYGLNELKRVDDSEGYLGGWDGRFRRAPYTDDGARRLAEGRFPKYLRGTLGP